MADGIAIYLMFVCKCSCYIQYYQAVAIRAYIQDTLETSTINRMPSAILNLAHFRTGQNMVSYLLITL